MNNPFPPLPEFDLRSHIKGSDTLSKEVQAIVPETRFIVKYKCDAKQCGKDHTYIVTARKHDPDCKGDGTGGGLWCDDCVDLSDNSRDDWPMCIRYDGTVGFHNRTMALALYGDLAFQYDPILGEDSKPTPSAKA